MTTRRRQLLAWLALGGLWAHFLTTLPATRPGPGELWQNDFAGYYGAAQVVLAGEPERLYEEGRKWYTNLPAIALLLAPLAKLPYEQAWELFWWLNLAAFAATFALLLVGAQRHLGPLGAERALLAGAIFLCFAPVLRRCLVLGQTTPLMLLLLAAAWLAARAGRPRRAGLLLGAVCAVKIPPFALLGVLLLRRRLALVGTALAVPAAALLLSWLVFGAELLGQFAERVVWNHLGSNHAAFNNAGLAGAATRLLTGRGLLDYEALPSPLAVQLAVAATLATLLGLWAWCGRGLLWPAAAPTEDARRGSLELELALGATLLVLVFPVVWIHYYLFLALPLALLAFWWPARGLPLQPLALLLLAAGIWLASGGEVPENRQVGARLAERGYRLGWNARPLGALLLGVGLAGPLAALARRGEGGA